MKKFGVIIMAILVVLSMAQCKKKTSSSSSSTTSSTVTLTVTLENSAFSRVNVNPVAGANNAAVEFETGDVVYVGNGGKYVGKLTYKNDHFSGTFTKKKLSENDYLHFYFLGNKTPAEQLSSGSTMECSVNISEQTAKFPVIAYGRSTEVYQKGVKTYEAVLSNQCAMVLFRINSIKPENTLTVTGLNNIVEVNFHANVGDTVGAPFTFRKDEESNGAIKLFSKSDTDRWAVLLPQAEVTNANASAFGYVTESDFTVPAITANEYYSDGINITLVSGGAVDGIFSVSKTKKVYFSSGNLTATTNDSWNSWTWSFAPHQYDKVETDNVNNNYYTESSVGLFGWATSGKNLRGTETDYYYKPFNTNATSTSYGPNGLYSLIAGNREGDWGVYNSSDITNGGGYNIWRTMMKEEWEYLVNFADNDNFRKVTVNGVKKVPYGKAVVMGVKGLVLLPDDWDGSMHPGFVYGRSNWDNEFTTLTTPTWPEMEAMGVVFLPAAGFRDDMTVQFVDDEGLYWTANSGTEQGSAGMFYFDRHDESMGNLPRHMGMSVRLVRNAQ